MAKVTIDINETPEVIREKLQAFNQLDKALTHEELTGLSGKLSENPNIMKIIRPFLEKERVSVSDLIKIIPQVYKEASK